MNFLLLDTVKLDFMQYNTENFYCIEASLVKDEKVNRSF